ncbi:glycoside hydrolase family 2 protein [Zasmidium cellare ATCC 36951]|uniref:Glycoside hydrolase family 2 protein n=1 Tax=Zasmidium cellare ATCC 36951 TaxID=1080233 RepID=A0A6A6CJR6_ZASCE|nr:glycoside hydrolase family 2 protein [Zasmidium cellare ATCC 36951]KAF2166390.1 glycoside hydrolase family 2 protein [Zasmidium cellare ATCC 36951]
MEVLKVALLSFAASTAAYGAPALVSSPGQSAAIPAWDLQSTASVHNDLSDVSKPSYDSSSWHHVGSKGTLMGGLVETGVYNADDLFYSTNLEDTVDSSEFAVPWLYRQEFPLQPGQGKHFLLQTNGITSKADVWLNGQQVANKSVQAGAYGGRTYDVTKLVNGQNALAIKAYPTDYNLDFALGFVDWNPYPPDNGTGVWRDVDVKQTGSVALGPTRVITDFKQPGASSVQATVKNELWNLENRTFNGLLTAVLKDDEGKTVATASQKFTIGASSKTTIALPATIQNPQVWWPKQWGDQPLYTVQLTVRTANSLSDQATRTFGIRSVTSQVNSHNDTIFSVNGRPFQVLGGGYSSDIFLRWDPAKFATQAQYVLDMGMNTIRLEGKLEHPELYDICDHIGLMVMPGWECCDKWEAWSYNDDVTDAPLWNNNDYMTAGQSMKYEVGALQGHASLLAYLVGSDYWPNQRAAKMYVDTLREGDWDVPIIASAAKRGYPECILPPSGFKMDGPYDWVPPNYWYGDQLGAAFGFGSELGAGVGTPEKGSLQKFLSFADMDDLWQSPNKQLYHMSRGESSFNNRTIYNQALYARYGDPTSLDDYLLKAQMMDYEATRAEYEGYAAKWNAERPATGAIYWMLNNAWPSLHWNQFDYYLHPAGSYFGTKVGCRVEHVAYDYQNKTVYLINRSLDNTGARSVEMEVVGLDGKSIARKNVSATTVPNTSKEVGNVPGIDKIKNVGFLRLVLRNNAGEVLSRNVYWLTSGNDELDWDDSTWYYTPVTDFVDLTSLQHMKPANVQATAKHSERGYSITLENQSNVPAVFIRLNLVDSRGQDITPVTWEDNYVSLLPKETMTVALSFDGRQQGAAVEMSGINVKAGKIVLGR